MKFCIGLSLEVHPMTKNTKKEKDAARIRYINLQRRLETLVYDHGADLFGVADLEPASEFIKDQGGEMLDVFPYAVSIGMRLSDLIVDNHSPDETHENSLYWWHVYRVVTPMLDRLAQRVQGVIQAEGHLTFHVPGSMPYNRETLKSLFPHKLAAHLSGLGWIGKNCLLITPDFGPRARFVTVLTDAPLSPGKTRDKKCGRCQACIEACPVQALKGIEFRPEEPVEARFDTRACELYRREHPCGLCVEKCPFGNPAKT